MCLMPEVAGNPRTIDDQRHGNLVQLLAAGGALECLPLFRQHAVLFSSRDQPDGRFWLAKNVSSILTRQRKAVMVCLSGNRRFRRNS